MQEFLNKLKKEVRKRNLKTDKEILKLRDELCKIYKPKQFPSLIQVLLYLKNKSIKIKPQRTLSGVAPVAVMTKPISCKHGRCVMCPGGVNSLFGNIPQSYTGKEPAALRAIRNKFDPYLQIFNRLEQYTLLNQIPEKVELIIMGGTFPSFNKDYQEKFITYCFKALNDFSYLFYKDNFNFEKFNRFFELPSENIHDKTRIKRIQNKILKLKTETKLEKEQKRNENSRIKDIALCIETRPDYCREKHIDNMLKQGATRIELGVQTIYDDILKKINRAHSVKDSITATQLLKDSFLKCCYHIMLDLPYSTDEKDTSMFKELFSNQNFKPDALKIYPCMLIKGTKLYELYQKKLYNPSSFEQTAEKIIEIKQLIPKYCRIMRIQRDIPSFIPENKQITNLRQYVHELMEERKIRCNCIRCREPKNNIIDFENIKILKHEYSASNGTEIFLSAEDVKNDLLLGFLRLRIPYKPLRKEITKNSAGVRELHVYGPLTQLGKKGVIQHQGLGKKLISEAEKIAKEDYDIKKLLVMSGIGARNYYKKVGYKQDGVYMSKMLS